MQFKPPLEVINKCVEVIGNGDKYKPWEMRKWASRHCESLIWWELLEMSDVSSWTGPDCCVIFYFLKQEDETIFKLRWS